MQRTKHLNGKSVDLPLKTLSDTFRRQFHGSFDSQNLGKPDLEQFQVEEYRTRLKPEHLRRLRSDKSRDEEKEDLAKKLQNPEGWLSDGVDIGYIPATKEVREDLSTVDYVNLIDVAYRAGMDVVVVPPFYEKEVAEIKNLIFAMIDYAKNALDGEIQIAPNLDISSMATPLIEEVMDYMEENYLEEEIPMISVRGFYPLSASTSFNRLREMTDRIVYVASCRKKINWRKQDPERGDEDSAYGKVSAEVLVTIMEADIIGRFYNLGGYPPSDGGPPPVSEMREEMYNPEEAIYNDVELNTVDRVPCHGCLICENYADKNLVDYFGSQSQQKLVKALSIHNELSVMKSIRELREMDAEERQIWINGRTSLEESLREIEI